MSFGPFFVGEKYTYTLTIKDSNTGDVVDLTGQTAKVHLRKKDASANKYTGSSEDATITDAANGVLTYDLPDAWVTADIGSWTLQPELTQGSVIRKPEKINFPVEDGL